MPYQLCMSYEVSDRADRVRRCSRCRSTPVDSLLAGNRRRAPRRSDVMATRIETARGATGGSTPTRCAPPGDRMRAIVRARLLDEIERRTGRGTTSRATSAASTSLHACRRDGLVGPGRPAGPRAARARPPRRSRSTLRRQRSRLPAAHAAPARSARSPASLTTSRRSTWATLRCTGPVSRSTAACCSNIAPTPPPLAGAAVEIDALWSQMPPAYWTAAGAVRGAESRRAAPRHLRRRARRHHAQRARARRFAPATQTLLRPLTVAQTRLQLSDRDGLAAGGAGDRYRRRRCGSEVIPIARSKLTPDVRPADLDHARTPGRAAASRRRALAPRPTPQLPCQRRRRWTAKPMPLDPCVVPRRRAGDGRRRVDRNRRRRRAASNTSASPALRDHHDADGYFRLPPIARVALVRLLVQHVAVTDGHPDRHASTTTSASTPLAVALE